MAVDEVKVYTPEVIADTPFPITGEDSTVESNSSSSQTTKEVYGSKQLVEKAFPLKMVAKELFSTAINTISKKILKTFEFAKSGAIQIGEYIHGLSGEIKISPDGIVAKNKDGNTTFALDGETGDAIFSGDVRASTFTSDYFNVDNKGNVIARSIRFLDGATASDYADGGYREIAGSETYSSSPPFLSVAESNRYLQYVPNLEIDLNLLNDSYVQFNLLISANVDQTAAQEAAAETYHFTCPIIVVEIVNGTWLTYEGNPIDVLGGTHLIYGGGNTDLSVYSIRYAAQVANETFQGCGDTSESFRAENIVQVKAGEHKYKVLADPKTLRFDSFWNSEARLYIGRSRLSAFTLGTV